MSAEERDRNYEAQSASPAAGVSMRALLASCAAADAVSKPPSGADAAAGSAAEPAKTPSAADGEASPHPGVASGQPRRDAA
jgi:hypothetical protein